MVFRHYLPAIVWALIVATLILLPGDKMPATPSLIGFDKIAHAGVFFILTILASVGLTKQKVSWPIDRQTIFVVFGSCLLYGIGLELTQSFIPKREFEIYDIVANVTGVISGFIGFWIIRKL